MGRDGGFTLSFVAGPESCGDGRDPQSMDRFRGQAYPWLSQLLPRLSAAGCDWEVLDWTDPGIDWASKDRLVLGPVWGYFDVQERFRAWLGKLEDAGLQVENSLAFLRWNLEKRYLLELGAAGIPIPRTELVLPGDSREWTRLALDRLRGWGCGQLVLKGVVDAAASGLAVFEERGIPDHRLHLESLKRERGGALLQEHLPEVNRHGELSFVCFDGSLGHSFLKVPRIGEDRVQAFFGGRSFPIRPGAFQACLDEVAAFRPDFELQVHQMRRAHAQALDHLDALRALLDAKGIPFPLYLRLDAVVRGEELLVMELEGIEPYMELAEAHAADPHCPSQDLYVEALLRRSQIPALVD